MPLNALLPKLAQSPLHEISVMYGDAISAAPCKEVVHACMAKHGRIDILVNNFGWSETGGPAEMNEEVGDRQMDVRIDVHCHLVLPIMET